MEKKLYADTKTLYINGNPVDYCYIGNLRYGEPVTQKTTLENLKDFYNIDNTLMDAGSSQSRSLEISKRSKLIGRFIAQRTLKISTS